MPHEGLWQQLDGLDRLETAKRAKCQYFADQQQYIVTMFNAEYVVELKKRQILSAGKPARFLEQLCLLSYLINAKDIPPAEKLVRAEALPAGEFFFRGPHALPTGKLEETFGENPQLLYAAGAKLNAKRRDFGDASVQIPLLPRLAITVIIWQSDEEFPGRASILFDKTAAEQMPADALLTAVNLVVDALAKYAKESG